MKLLAVSDVVEPSLHKDFDRAKFPDVDLIVSCGDLPPEYLSFLATAFDAPMVYVKGNHDIRYAHKPPALADHRRGLAHPGRAGVPHRGVAALAADIAPPDPRWT